MSTLKNKRYPEAELLALIGQRHSDGAAALYDMYSASLYGVISRMLRNTALSEDILQETFIRVWQSFGAYDPDKGRLFTWMVNIARHLAIDQLRSKAYRNALLNEELGVADEVYITPDSIYSRAERPFVRQQVNLLESKEQQVMQLIYFRGLTHAEAAEALKLPLGTVKTLWMRAIKQLRAHYNTGTVSLAS